MFCSSVFTLVPCTRFAGPGGVPEMRTSTRIPGVTNPATPTTSSTLTAQARMPWRMVAAKPPPEPTAASRLSTIGSP